MKVLILFLGVMSLVYKGDCAITEWTEPAISSISGHGTLTYAENHAVGTLTTLAATTGGNAFVITSQPTTGKLAVVLATGVLSLETGFFFDYETEPTYVIVVTGGDGSGSTGTATITVSITDIANDANYGTLSTEFYRVDDAIAASTTVDTITASGGTGTAYTILTTGNTNTDFAYASATGVLTTANVMARSTTAAYSLTIQAVAATMTSTAKIIVCVGTSAQCGGGAAGIQISLAMLLVAIVMSRIK